jgi:hypothetical protein
MHHYNRGLSKGGYKDKISDVIKDLPKILLLTTTISGSVCLILYFIL